MRYISVLQVKEKKNLWIHIYTPLQHSPPKNGVHLTVNEVRLPLKMYLPTGTCGLRHVLQRKIREGR